jgi:hypothetical protein
MSIFEKGTSRVEIFIHHHSFGVRPPFFAGLPFCSYLLFYFIRDLEHYGVDKSSQTFRKRWGEIWRTSFS